MATERQHGAGAARAWWKQMAGLALAALVLLSACTSGATPAAPAGGGSSAGGQAASSSAPAAPKVLTIGIQGELTDFYGFGGIRGGGITQIPPIALDTL